MERIKNINDKLDAYLRGDLSTADSAAVEEELRRDPSLMDEARGLSMANYLTDSIYFERSNAAVAAFDNFKTRIHRTKTKKIRNRLEGIAAIITVPLLIISGYLYITLNRLDHTDIEITSNTGMTSSVVLPDSTRVWLNSNSTLSYPSRFIGKQRRVQLSGEAYFEVLPGSKKKFIVETGPVEIEVYGTSFNVESYPYEHFIYTTLVEGSVTIRYENSRGEKMRSRLLPGHTTGYHRTGRYTTTRITDTAVATSWREGRIMFRDTPLEDALRMIGNKYNAAFMIKDDRLREHTFVGTFSDQTLDTILKHFSLSSDIRFRTVKDAAVAEMNGRDIIEVYRD